MNAKLCALYLILREKGGLSLFSLLSGNEVKSAGDYRPLSHVSNPDRYYLAHVAKNLHEKAILSKTSLVRSYHQIPGNIPKTAITIPLELFEFLCTLSNYKTPLKYSSYS